MPEMIWQDRKRILGMPITFTKYSMSEDRLFIKKGFLNLSTDELLLYRVRDISLKRSLVPANLRGGERCCVFFRSNDPLFGIEEYQKQRRGQGAAPSAGGGG